MARYPTYLVALIVAVSVAVSATAPAAPAEENVAIGMWHMGEPQDDRAT